MADWLDCLGEYECQPPIGYHEALGAVVAELDALARPKVAPSDLPQIQHLPLKICVVGTPFGGVCVYGAGVPSLDQGFSATWFAQTHSLLSYMAFMTDHPQDMPGILFKSLANVLV